MLRTNVEVITPACAEAYLKTNLSKQRKLNKGQVVHYARMMMEGQWQLNGEAIVFDKTGALVNGQHRLYACITANVPFETVVVRDVDENSFYTFDSGHNRTKSQVFQIANIPYGSRVSSIIGVYLRMTRMPQFTSIDTVKGISHGNIKVSADDLLKAYNANAQYWQDLCKLTLSMYKHCGLLPQVEAAAIFAFLNKAKGYDWDYVADFFEQIYYEENCKLDVLRKLRKKLINARMGTMRMVSQCRTQLLIKAWECYKNGRNPRTLTWNKNTEDARCFE